MIIRITQPLFFIFFFSPIASGGLSGPTNYKVTSANGEYVFVQICEPNSTTQVQNAPSFSASDKDLYPETGVYTKSDPPKLVQPFTNRSLRTNVRYVSDDGQYVVGLNDESTMGTTYMVNQVTRIFLNGRLLHQIDHFDYEFAPRLKVYLSGDFAKLENYEFNPNILTLTLVTNQGALSVFDINTGKLIRQKDPFRDKLLWGTGLLALILFLFTSALVVRCMNQFKNSNKKVME